MVSYAGCLCVKHTAHPHPNASQNPAQLHCSNNGSTVCRCKGMTRYKAWQKIQSEQLLIPPPAECELVLSKPEQRKVKPDLTVDFEGRVFDVSKISFVMVDTFSAVFKRERMTRKLAFIALSFQTQLHGNFMTFAIFGFVQATCYQINIAWVYSHFHAPIEPMFCLHVQIWFSLVQVSVPLFFTFSRLAN